MKFEDLGISEDIIKILRNSGIKTPTEIQEKALRIY